MVSLIIIILTKKKKMILMVYRFYSHIIRRFIQKCFRKRALKYFANKKSYQKVDIIGGYAGEFLKKLSWFHCRKNKIIDKRNFLKTSSYLNHIPK